MEVKIDELEVGDEILISSGSSLSYLRVLRKPAKNPKTTRWKSVRCSLRNDYVTRVYGKQSYKVPMRICTGEGHNTQVYRDLSYKTIWLVRRKEI